MSEKAIANPRQNIETEIATVREIANYTEKLLMATTPDEKKLLSDTLKSLRAMIKTINNAIPKVLDGISVARKLPSFPSEEAPTLPKKIQLTRVSAGEGSQEVTLREEDREKFLKELRITHSLIRKIKKRRPEEEKEIVKEFKKASGYLKLSNRFFQNSAVRQIKKGRFAKLPDELKRANVDILFQTYVAMILFTTFLSFFIGLFLVAFLLFFEVGFTFPFIGITDQGILIRLLKFFWIPFVLPVLTFVTVYLYPNAEKGSISKKIDRELPFAVIHMSAISGSGIEPTKIFTIIGLSREYPFLRKEIRKVLNQINLYGYDLVTALNNVSKTTPSKKMSELFAGLSATITSGGDLQGFFEKRAETLLIGYRLEREKFTKMAETFMDIYISLVVATPMILILLLIMISISGVNVGFSPTQITFIIIAVIGLINVVFLGILHFKQPAY